MALIKCKECGKEVSEEANFCPNCGNPDVIKQIWIESLKIYKEQSEEDAIKFIMKSKGWSHNAAKYYIDNGPLLKNTQQEDIHTIKKIAIFWCVLTIISVVVYIIYLITLLK